jgi:hypothetical protein
VRRRRCAVAVLVLAGACVDRMLVGEGELAADAGGSEPSRGDDDPVEDSGSPTATDPTPELPFDPYPDCRPLLPYDQLYDPTTCTAGIGVTKLDHDDPEVCDTCMCLRECDDVGDCPPPPSRPNAEMHCSKLPQSAACLIACSSVVDCPPEMICRARAEYLPDAPEKVCAFGAMRPACDPYDDDG